LDSKSFCLHFSTIACSINTRIKAISYHTYGIRSHKHALILPIDLIFFLILQIIWCKKIALLIIGLRLILTVFADTFFLLF
jgi:hypothetical protein